MVSTKGRYALRVMCDLAVQGNNRFIPLTDIAKRQEISEKYLESIVASLTKAGLLDSVRGKKGGYKLNRPVEEYTVKDILAATENHLATVACLSKEVNDCPRKDKCTTLKMWQELNDMVNGFYTKTTLKTLIEN